MRVDHKDAAAIALMMASRAPGRDYKGLAANLAREEGERVLHHSRDIAEARAVGREEGRRLLVEALLSELEAARLDFRAVDVAMRRACLQRQPGLNVGEEMAAEQGWRLFAAHVSKWLEAGSAQKGGTA